MASSTLYGALAIVALISISVCHGLRTGAPSLACVGMRPFHGLHSAKPASASQFFLTQSSLTYEPGQNVTVEILTHSAERYFRGFLVQAYDPLTGANIGRFLPNFQSRPLDGCSAATHRENLNKKEVSLTWLPPTFSPGSANLDQSPSIASQWLGLPQSNQQSHGNRHQPSLIMAVNRQKRQTQPAPPASPATPATSVSSPTERNATNGNSHVSPWHQPNGVHQVRFRATIVVTYEEFYTGFESSDQKFDKFDFATNAAHSNP